MITRKDSVSLSDFCPVNHWSPDLEVGAYFKNPKGQTQGKPMFLIDHTTDQRYLNQSKIIVGLKCFCLTLGTPLVHSAVSVMNIVDKILKLVALSHFWIKKDGKGGSSLKERAVDAGNDLLRVI